MGEAWSRAAWWQRDLIAVHAVSMPGLVAVASYAAFRFGSPMPHGWLAAIVGLSVLAFGSGTILGLTLVRNA